LFGAVRVFFFRNCPLERAILISVQKLIIFLIKFIQTLNGCGNGDGFAVRESQGQGGGGISKQRLFILK
jgi:hypothetical protein